MKAITFNKKHALPLMLLGLLALQTQSFFKMPIMSSELASTAESLDGSAEEFCRDPNVKSTINRSVKSGSGTFSLTRKEFGDFEDKYEVGDVEMEFRYQGLVEIDRVTTSPMTIIDLRNNRKIDEMGCSHLDFGDYEVKPVDVVEDSGRVRKLRKYNETGNPIFQSERLNDKGEVELYYGKWHEPVQRFERFHILRVKVSAKTTEAEFENCEECRAKTVSSSSAYRCVKVPVSPNPQVSTFTCKDTVRAAFKGFEDSERSMKSKAITTLEEIIEKVNDAKEKDQLEEYRKELVENCKLKPGATLSDARRYKKNREIRNELSYAGKPDEKLECEMDYVDDAKNVRDRYARFQARVLPDIKQKLTSPVATERAEGRNLLQGLRSEEYGDLSSYEQSLLMHTQANFNAYEQILNKRTQLAANPNDPSLQLQLQTLENQLNFSYQKAAMVGGPLAEENSYWQSQINSIATQVNTSSINNANPLNYNLSGRGSRLTGEPLAKAFLQARESMNSTPNYMTTTQNPRRAYFHGGVDAAYPQQSSRYSPYTAPPGPERSAGQSRLSRN